MPEDLATISVDAAEGATVVTVSGEVDMSNAERLLEELLANVGRRPWLLVDLSGCSYLDSAGLGAIARVHARCREGGVGLGLVVPDGGTNVERVLSMTGMDEVLTVDRSLPDALARAAAGPDDPVA